MSVDYTRSEGETPNDSEPMFAPTPMWDRSKKNRAQARAERRSFFDRDDSAEAFDAPARRGRAGKRDTDAAVAASAAGGVAAGSMESDSVRETAMSPNGEDAPYVASDRRTVVRRDRSVAPAAVVGGLVALAALAAAGWYATRPADKTLTPGGPNGPATAIAANPPAGGNELAANTPPASAAEQAATANAATPSSTTTHTTVTHRTTTTATPTVARRSTTVTTRAAPASSATTAGVDTATRAPATSVGVVPSTPSTAAPPPAAAPVTPPVTATPAPAPTTPAPTPDVTAPATTTAPTTTAPPTTSPQ